MESQVDELGRGTSNRDGSALAWSISERILLKPDTFCLFATHYLSLSNLRSMYSGHCHAVQLTVDHQPERMVFLYRVQAGVCSQRNYMCAPLAPLAHNRAYTHQRVSTPAVSVRVCNRTDFLASMAGLPPSVCERARNLSQTIDFDPVDQPSPRQTTHEVYHQVARLAHVLAHRQPCAFAVCDTECNTVGRSMSS